MISADNFFEEGGACGILANLYQPIAKAADIKYKLEQSMF